MLTAEFIRKSEIFKDLNENQVEEILKNHHCITLRKKERLYNQGDQIQYMYLVMKGSIKLGSDINQEKSLVKHIAYPGDIFGENIFNSKNRSEYAEILKDSDIIAIKVDTIKKLLVENLAFANKITEVIIERINNLENRMKNFIFMKAQKRIANFLKQTAQGRGILIGLDEILINHGMSHKDISYLTDTSRQTVTRVLAELKMDNIIHFSARKPNKILIRNIAAL